MRLLAATLMVLVFPGLALAAAGPPGGDVCGFIARQQAGQSWPTRPPGSYDTANVFLQRRFMHQGVFDLDGDGIAEHVVQADTGTMHGEAYDFVLSSAPPDGAPAEPAPAGNYVLDGFGEAWLPYGARIYDVTFSDEGGAFVLAASYFRHGGARHLACVFANTVTGSWALDPDALASAQGRALAGMLCPDLPSGAHAAAALKPVAPSQRLADPDKIESIAFGGGFLHPDCTPDQADCKDVWRVDFDNDGVSDRLLKMSGASGAGRGCDLEYFDLLGPGGAIAKGAKRDLLLKLQHVDLTDVYPVRPCGLGFDWISRRGRVVLERHPRADNGVPGDSFSLVHDLFIADRGKTLRLCRATFTVTPRVVYRAP